MSSDAPSHRPAGSARRGLALRLGGALSILALAGCVTDAPLPDLGACAEPPPGVYEYGQIGIGTCLAGPNDLAFLDGGRVLAVSNANPWKDFTGGSALFLDLSTVDWAQGRNVIAPAEGGEGVTARALGLPSFAGAMALAEAHDLLVVTNRLSENARTREEPDDLWFVDVSDPDAPDYADVGPDGPTLTVGWDPVAIHYAASTDIAWVINRTAHTLALVDLAASPVELVPPGGPTRLEANAFVDTDGSGSQAAFVTLGTVEIPEGSEPDLGAHTWSLDWSVGTVRMWLPTADGAYRVTGNGETTWDRSAVPVDLDLADADGVVLEVNDPHYAIEPQSDGAYLSRMVFEDQGVLRAASAGYTLEAFDWESSPLLQPSADGWDTEIGGPSLLVEGSTAWYLYYDGGSGGDRAIGLATSVDGATFVRASGDPVLAVDGASITDPFVLWDEQAALWRMYFTIEGATDDAATIGEAVSENLAEWTLRDATFAPEGGASAPAVGYINGAFHLYYTTTTVDGPALGEAVGIDGSTWTPVGTPFVVDPDTDLSGGVALQMSPEEAFTLEDQGGATFPLTLSPGATQVSTTGGWELRVAVGQAADPESIGQAGISLDSVYADRAYLTYTDDLGILSIGTGEIVGSALTLDAEPVLEAGAGGAHDADGVSSGVVAEIGGEQVMYYAAHAGDITTIGRATSTDGLAWSADDTPVLAPSADWDSVAVEPGSVQVLDDGTVRLWFTAFDGTNYRIGLAESADGVTFARVPGTQYEWVFDASAPGDWFDTGVRHPWVVRDGDTDRMWFAGDGGTALQIGYAERTGDDADWVTATTVDAAERPVLAAALGGFGIGGVSRPVVVPSDAGWTLWYTGQDDTQSRVGRAVGTEVDRFHRDLRMPTVGDTWSFTTVPAREGETLTLDVTVEGTALAGGACSALAEDEDRGFLYVGCALVPYVYVVDIRDDSVGDFADLNYLDIESVIRIETSTGGQSGMRSLVVDRDRGWLWGVSDAPEAIYAIDLSGLTDDGSVEFVRENVVAMFALPWKDEGVTTESNVGPAQLAFHPDGRHLLVTNFNGNSVSAYDLGVGTLGTLVAQTEAVGENPYAIAISPDGTFAAVANYSGEVEDAHSGSTIALLDADPESPTFLQVKTWLVNK
ncbi:MAG: beta-propeller fold lactonase family protein [Pseudomonadota bacterium]|nr:beta-propeller fold lactonase family protein [Pseudomonadota bacterium]